MSSPFDHIETILERIRHESDPQKCFDDILKIGRGAIKSSIWNEYGGGGFLSSIIGKKSRMNLERDILEAESWLRRVTANHPDFNGIYLGLDTLNMEDDEGFNLTIGIGSTCDPATEDHEWLGDCDYSQEEHLIRSLSHVGNSFTDERWAYEEREMAEYIVFLGYSGIVLREALLKLNPPQDFKSIWGFHDGDLFGLVQKVGGKMEVVAG